MTFKHSLLAILVTFLWGVNFLFIKLGLVTTPPLLLAFMRFAAVGCLAFFFPRPQIAWTMLIALGFFMFVGQFSFMFVSLNLGAPPGLLSVLIQSQVIFTITFISIIERKLPSRGTLIGFAVAMGGLWLIGQSVAGDQNITLIEFTMVLLAASCWGYGNILMARLGKVDMLATITWMSVVSIPFFALFSLVFEGPSLIWQSLHQFDWTTAISVLFISFISTSVCYSGWGWLIRHYGASSVSPYSLLVPVTGVISSAIIIGESFDTLRIGGILLILCGLVILSILRYREAHPRGDR